MPSRLPRGIIVPPLVTCFPQPLRPPGKHTREASQSCLPAVPISSLDLLAFFQIFEGLLARCATLPSQGLGVRSSFVLSHAQGRIRTYRSDSVLGQRMPSVCFSTTRTTLKKLSGQDLHLHCPRSAIFPCRDVYTILLPPDS